MRKLILFLGLTLAVGSISVSCSRDDEKTSVTKRYNVVGKWKFSEYYDEGNWKDMGILKQYIDLKEDNSYQTNFLNVPDKGTYTYDGNDLIVTKSDSYGNNNIRIKNMTEDYAEVEVSREGSQEDKAMFRLRK